jgi:hypothetical protein
MSDWKRKWGKSWTGDGSKGHGKKKNRNVNKVKWYGVLWLI